MTLRSAGLALSLAAALAVACGQGAHAPGTEPEVTQPSGTTRTGTQPDTSVPTTPATNADKDSGSDDLDAGPIQFQYHFDASTIPTSTYVLGVDASAGEAERGFADDPDAGQDAG